MNNRKLKKLLTEYISHAKNEKGNVARMEETRKLCVAIMREQVVQQPDPRQSFWTFLSDVFRFDGIPILALQLVTLLLVGLHIHNAAGHLEYNPVYMPLFVLAVMPTFFRGQYYRMSEIEAATRSSGAQIILAKLILAGAASLICMTALLELEICLWGSSRELGQMILYCLVPYLMCMTVMLRFIRREKNDGIPLCVGTTLGLCVLWCISSHSWPWLYGLSALGVWITAFIIFSAFFTREIYYIVKANKEGKMYGFVV